MNRIRLRVHWESFLVRIHRKTSDKAIADLMTYFRKKGWLHVGVYEGTVEDVIKEAEREYEQIQKIEVERK